MKKTPRKGCAPTTTKIVRAILESDTTIPKGRVEDTLDVLAGNRKAVELKDGEKIRRPYSRTEVATLAGLSVKSIDRYAKLGLLKRVTRTGSVRSIGFDPSSVESFVKGREVRQ